MKLDICYRLEVISIIFVSSVLIVQELYIGTHQEDTDIFSKFQATGYGPGPSSTVRQSSSGHQNLSHKL